MTSNRVFLSALGLLAAGCFSAVGAQAQSSEAVLFKIHDVQPVKGENNLINACDYNVTVYNRSSKDIASASLMLTWTDDTINSVISDAKVQNKADSGTNLRQVISRTEASSPVQISSQLSIPALPPQKQVSVRARIQTDRCFLLMGPVQAEVKSCRINADKTGATNRRTSARASATECEGLFQYVSPENPEYYREFKPISYDDEKIQGEAKRAQERNAINSQYDAVVTELSKVPTVLDGIKGDVSLDGVKAAGGQNDKVLSDKLQQLFPKAEKTAQENSPAQPSATTDKKA